MSPVNAEGRVGGRNVGVAPDAVLPQIEVFEQATLFAQTEGIVPAPEAAHAIAAVAREAVRAREAGAKRVLLFNLSGHGLLDLSAYETFQAGKLQDVLQSAYVTSSAV